uniref:Putative Na+ channel toxin n=1 Tax=Superstitionia donensis TaxID=311983 RepID=A0A1V1WBQ9_9SCOR
MKTAFLSIVVFLLMLHLDTVLLQIYDGDLYTKDGSIPCLKHGQDKYCKRICAEHGAHGGSCHGLPSRCWCEGLDIRKHGGYPKNEKGDYVWCGLPGGENKDCQDVCKKKGSGYGYCYDRYCWCEAPQ